MMTTITPNAPSTANDANAVSDESIASKMAAMRNHVQATRTEATGNVESEAEATSPAVPEGSEDETNYEYSGDAGTEEDTAQTESVSDPETDSTSDDLIDFIEFADTNPNAKFKFTRNGKEVVIDAKKAAAILGQGGAIHEEARQLKVERSEFDEYIKETRARQEGLTLAMEFTVQPQLQKAYDEIVKTQGYQTVFNQQLAQTQDPAQQARIQASMQQNENYIRQQQATIGQLKPAVDQFRQIRREQVASVLETNRKNFKDKDLKNEYVFNELRDKVSRLWPEARAEIIPGIPNIDLISSDENLLALVRDGLKYRSKPSTKQAGSSIAALTSRRGNTQGGRNSDGEIGKLREAAKTGDKKAGDNLLMQRLSQIRGSRGGR